MKKRKQPFVIFICIIVVMSFYFEWMHGVLTGGYNKNLMCDLFMDLPFISLMAFVSLGIVHATNKYFKYRDNIYIRVIFELAAASLFTIIFVFSINYVTKVLMSKPPAYLEANIVLLTGNFFVVLMLELFFYNQRQLEATKHIAAIEKEKIEYMYATLKAQINPHFLFNSLNVLSSLIFEDARKANKYTKKLSNIYRYVLSTNAVDRVSVTEEIAFLESYIYLLSIRFDDALEILITGDKNRREYVIPVSLQLLIENAIKHNVVSVEHPLIVNINIEEAYVEVKNNLQLRSSKEESGHGLSNLKKQYMLHNKMIEINRTDAHFLVRLPYL